MSKKILFIISIIIFIFFFFFFLDHPNNVLAKKKENEKNYLPFNKNWEEFFDQPIYLEIKEKNQLFPFYLEEFLKEEYFFQTKVSSKTLNEIINPQFCPLQKNNTFDNICLFSQPFSVLSQKSKIRHFILDTDTLKNFLKSLAEKTNSAPVEGRYRLDENNNFVPLEESRDGFNLDIDKNQKLLEEKIYSGKISLENNLVLIVDRISPSVTPESLKNLGIKEKIAHGESNFAGSPKNRIHNIHTAAAKFDGIIIKPDEEFSFVSTLGPVDETTGYKEELVIKDNKTIPEFGGGVCQVSTTLFRTALNAGLKITERKNHAYPVQYYAPQGTDATIYIPKPDLKFINDTPGYILVQVGFNGNILYFDFFGTSDGRQVELEGPTVTERTEDGKMKIVLYQIIKNTKGEEIRRDTFKSLYDNPAKYHEPEFITKPKNWSNKQWEEYLAKRNH